MKPPVWVRLLAALGVVLVGFPSALLVSLTLAAVVDGFELAAAALLVCGVIGLVTVGFLYRLARGDMLGRNGMTAMAAGLVVSVGGIAIGYTLLNRGFEKRHVTHMKSDLRTLAADQERYFKQHGRFASDTSMLYRGRRYPSPVRITLEHGDDLSWRASATIAAAPKRSCRITGTHTTPVTDPLCD
jgi:Tfp pilus assembly protein PilE